MSQGALAKAAGLTASEVSRIECGYRDLSASEGLAIANALGVSAEEIQDKPRASAAPVPPVVAAEAPVVVPSAIPQSPLVPGNDLGDPVNFRELPDLGLLDQGSLEANAVRARLHQAVERSNAVLHTSKVPAAVWRAWRDFERRAQDILRASTPESTAATESSAVRPNGNSVAPRQLQGPDPLALAERSFRRGLSSKSRHQQKSFNARFLDAARRILPREVADRLTATAEYRLRFDCSIGFVRHFRQVAGEVLPEMELRRVLGAITETDLKRRPGRYAGDPANSSFN